MENNLKALRLERGLSQPRLAEMMGTTKNQLIKLEKGERRLTAGWIERAAKALDVSPGRLVDIEFGQEKPGLVSAPIISWVQAGSLGELISSNLRDAPRITADGLDANGEWIALRVEGDSMDRISPPESIIFVNLKDTRTIPNACYVIANEQGDATYKRFRPNPERWEPVSVNSEHEAVYPSEGEALRIIGRVRKSVLDM